MEKSFLTETILESYHAKLSPKDSDDLFRTLNKLAKESKDVNEMAKRFDELTQYKLLHEAFMREKAELTNNSASTIKIIIVVYFICSFILALYLYDKFVI